MPNVSYDTLSIKIEADSSQANNTIGKLSTSLRNLDKALKDLDTNRVKEVRGLLQSIAKIDFSNVTKGLQSIVTAFKAFNTKAMSKAFDKVANTDIQTNYPTPPAEVMLPSVPTFGVSEDLEDTTVEAEKLSFQLQTVKESFDKAFGGETSADMDNAKKGLDDIINALMKANFTNEQINAIIRSIHKEMALFNASEIEALRGVFANLGVDAEQAEKYIQNLKTDIEETLSPLDQLKEKLSSSGFNDQQISAVLREIKTEMGGFTTEELDRVREILIQMGYSAEDADKAVKNIGKDMNKLDGGAKKGASGLAKLANQFKNIMKYRIIRKIIQELYKAISEGIKNVASFDEATSNTVNELKSKFEFLKNSLGSILAPLIQMIAPILEAIMTIVGEVNNAIAEMFASFNGQEMFASATDEVKDFNEEVKKSQSLGIDELNVVNQEDKSTGFEMKETTSEMGGVFKDALGALKDIIDSIKPVLLDVVKSLKPLLQSIGNLLASIMPIIQVVVNLINQLVGKTAEGVNKSIASLINAISMVLNVIGMVLKILEPILSIIIEVIGAVINIINTVISVVLNAITDVLRPIFALLQVVFNVISPLLNTLSNLIKNIIRVVENVIKGIMSVAGGVLSVISNVLCAIAPLLEALVNVLGFKWLDKTPAWVRAVLGVATGGLSEIAHFLTSGHFATGGFPEDGFFYANHNELVGQFSNGQTAVANNEQITQGIYLAVLQAMRDSEGGSKTISIQIDGKEIAKAVNKQNANAGYEGINGGYKYGY